MQFQVVDSSGNPFDVSRHEGLYTFIDTGNENKNIYYRVENSKAFEFLGRIKELAILLFKSIISLGFCFFDSHTLSQWREVYWNKKEVSIFLEDQSLIRFSFPLHPTHTQLTEFLTADLTNHPCDRVSKCIKALDGFKNKKQTPNLDPMELKDLIIGLERYELLMDIANSRCEEMVYFDRMEIFLHLLSSLKDSLLLNWEMDPITFCFNSGLTENDIENVREIIIEQTDPLENQVQLLIRDASWRKVCENHEDFGLERQYIVEQEIKISEDVDPKDQKAMDAFNDLRVRNGRNLWNPYYVITKAMLKK